MSEELLNESINIKIAAAKEKATELTEKLGVKVHPMVFYTTAGSDDLVIGFVKEPNRLVKARAMDKVQLGQFSDAYADLLTICLVKEDSDHRITSESSENDKYYFGATKFCGGMLKLSLDQAEEKKN